MASWPWRYSRYAGGWGAVGEGGRSGHGGRGGASRQPAASRPRLGLSRPRAQRRACAQTAQRDLILTPGSSADGVAVFSRPPCLSLLYLLVCWLINVCTRAFIHRRVSRHVHATHAHAACDMHSVHAHAHACAYVHAHVVHVHVQSSARRNQTTRACIHC
jgi:hypothetical protein